jgi:hypothetical protein
MDKKKILPRYRNFSFAPRILFLLVLLSSILTSNACTVFILTDGRHTYFFNNEDFTNPNTRIWFIPKGKEHYGSAYVGYNDGEAQGGINTEGLAFDWVTVDIDSYETDPNYIPENHLIRLNGNSSQWMLEQCKTVEEAIKFYHIYREPAFANSTLIIADKSGASVIIGSKNGKLYFNTSQKSRGLGFGEATFQKLYKAETALDVNEGAQILKQCVAPGNGGTKYSNAYDLKTGDVVFYNFGGQKITQTKFNLLKELEKGSHYYETTQIASQIQQPVRPLMLNMNRHILFINKPLANQDIVFTTKIKNLFADVISGKLKYDDLTENFSNDLKKNEADVKSMMERLGKLNSLSLIYKGKTQEFDDYSYVMKFDNVTILWQFLVNDKNKIHDFNTLSAFWIR